MSEQEEKMLSTKDEVIIWLQRASKGLGEAYNAAVAKTPLAQDLAVFQSMQAMQKEISQMMLHIQKLRGL